MQLIIKDIHSEGLNQEEEASKIKIYDHRKKTNIFAQVNDYIKNSKKSVVVFSENRSITESLKPFVNIYSSIINRNNLHKSDVLMFFDYPAEEEVYQSIIKSVNPDTIHYMNYAQTGNHEENILKTFSGMIRYTCNNLNGEFNLARASAAMGVTNVVIETLLEMFEDVEMIKIKERAEDIFLIEFIQTVELSKAIHTMKYAEFVELLNSVNEYKSKFMTMDI